MLDLQAGVHLDEIELPPDTDELNGTGADVVTARAAATAASPMRTRSSSGSPRRAPLQSPSDDDVAAAVALEEIDAVPMRIGEHLISTCRGWSDTFSSSSCHRPMRPSIRGWRLSALPPVACRRTMRMPLPPPPRSLDQHRIADSSASSAAFLAVLAQRRRYPGTSGTPPCRRRVLIATSTHDTNTSMGRTNEDHAACASSSANSRSQTGSHSQGESPAAHRSSCNIGITSPRR